MRRTGQGVTPSRSRRRKPSLARRLLLIAAVVVGAGVVLGLVFAGSPTTIAKGVRIDGIDVGGLEATQRAGPALPEVGRLAQQPIVFVAAGKRFSIAPTQLGVEPDWHAAIDAAQRQGNGFGPLRGFRRIGVDVFGADVTPPTRVFHGALQYELRQIAKAVDRKSRSAAIVRHGLNVVVVPARAGHVLDRAAAATTIVESLASLNRSAGPVPLPLRVDAPRVRAAALAPVVAQARVALSGPVALQLGEKRWLIQPQRLARLLELPSDGQTALQIGGPEAELWLKRIGRGVESPPKNATFAVHGSHIAVVPAKPGLRLDTAAAAAAVLAAALHTRPDRRVTVLPVHEQQAKLTTEDAAALGIHGVVSTYTTVFGGIANRIHNVELVAHLVDDKLISPGEEFSFNKTTGARTAAKGFLEAPVIINGEVTTGLGGGVCQVSTTVFNAAYEAGLQDHRADESRALHQPLPAGPRRDRRLPRRRSPVHQRHGPLAAAPHLRQLRLADRRPLRDADAPEGREPDRAARRARQGADQEDDRQDAEAGGEGHRRSRRAGDDDERDARRLRAPAASSSTTTCSTRRTAPRRSSCASARRRSRRSREEAGYGDGSDDDSARSIASTSQSGIRVGLNVAASTHACAVQPSASSSPSSRTIAYS